MGEGEFTRIAIVNRGEAAVRLIRAVRELNLEHIRHAHDRVPHRGRAARDVRARGRRGVGDRSMVAKVIGWGKDREEARVRLRRALAETRVLVRGGTTKAFLLDLLDRPEVIAGTTDTGWLDRLVASGG